MNNTVLKSVGSKIKSIRLSKNLSQYQLAVMCGFEKASMSRLESGQSNATILTLLKVSKALDVPLYNFFAEIV